MKTVSFLAVTTLLAATFTPPAQAQDASGFLFPIPTDPVTVEEEEQVPQKIEIPADPIESSARDNENALLPDNTAPTPSSSSENPPALKRGTAEQLRLAARIRELKTIAQSDPEVLAQLELERKATTPEGHRTAMRNYYTLLYRKIAKLDPSVEKAALQQLQAKLATLRQSRIRPSTLIEDIKRVPGSSPEEVEQKIQANR